MKANVELLLDVIYKKIKIEEMFIEELKTSLEMADENNVYIYEHDIEQKEENIRFLSDFANAIKQEGFDYLKEYINKNKDLEEGLSVRKFSKVQIVKSLLKEYKSEYKRNYWNSKYVGINGIFDNELFCNIIKKRIDRYVYCNDVTKAKYKHLVAFLNELLHEMENSKNPLKTLKYKMKLYQRYKKTEYIEIRKQQKSKVDVIKDILEEYKKEKKVVNRCS